MKLTNGFKKWFYTPDPEGITNYDALCAFIFNVSAWTLIFTFAGWLV
jgi:hypothetical protein